MSWLRERLKNRLLSLPEDLASGVKQLSTSGVPVTLGFSSSSSGQDPISPEYCGRRVQERLNAGSELLKAYQDQWESMHTENEANAALASECDVQITKLRRKVESDWSNVASLQTLASQVARVAEQVGHAEDLLNSLETEFSRVEVALLGLEDTLDARQMQSRQEGQAREVDRHEDRRKKQFEQLSDRLHADYAAKKKESESREAKLKQEKGLKYQQKFQEDMAAFSSGLGLLQVPRRHDQDASLETVDLDADEDELENFLGDVPNASPLPKDDDIDNESHSISLDDDDDVDNKLGIPRAESMYYTPSDTLEDIAGAVEKVKLDGD